MNWLKNSCFVSYRHGQHQIKERFVREFHDGLAAELELLRNEPVFVDYGHLQSGDFYNLSLARELYSSGCMVLIYQPNYFDLQHTYCAREYRAMCALEEQRRSRLDADERTHSLIVPVVLRGFDGMPYELSAHRQCEDFSKFLLTDDALSRHPSYATRLKAIAEYVHFRCQALEVANVEGGAEGFELPSEEASREWLRTLAFPKTRFPGAGQE